MILGEQCAGIHKLERFYRQNKYSLPAVYDGWAMAGLHVETQLLDEADQAGDRRWSPFSWKVQVLEVYHLSHQVLLQPESVSVSYVSMS